MKPLINHVLVATSGSDASINAAKYAIILAKQYKCKLSAIYVVDTATLRELLISRIFVEEESKEYQHSLEANGHRYLNFTEELAIKKGVKIDKILKSGAIYTEILKTADEIGAELIILGGWEENRDVRDLITHAQKEVLLNAKCSVLVVKEHNIEAIYKNS